VRWRRAAQPCAAATPSRVCFCGELARAMSCARRVGRVNQSLRAWATAPELPLHGTHEQSAARAS